MDSLRVASGSTAFTSCNDKLKNEVEMLFSKQQLHCESASLAAIRSNDDAVLVTDDQFLFAVANMEGFPTVGLTGLLSQTSLPWESLLSASKKLKGMNYANYLPIHLYKRIVDQMLDSESDSEMASAEIQAWILSDTEGDATPYHEGIIIALLREVVEQGLDYLNPGNLLMNVVLGIVEKRKPGFIEKCISDAFESLFNTKKEVDSDEAL